SAPADLAFAASPAHPAWPPPTALDLADAPDAAPWVRADLQAALGRGAGLSRNADALTAAAGELARLATPPVVDEKSAEDANLLLCARALVASARRRRTSLGAHHRTDSVPAGDEVDGPP
ncbi:MAG: hypothetical protein ACTMIR_15410, partial [Cellulomonadaceae bacterium]